MEVPLIWSELYVDQGIGGPEHISSEGETVPALDVAPGESVVFTFADFLGINEADLLRNAKVFSLSMIITALVQNHLLSHWCVQNRMITRLCYTGINGANSQ